MKKGKVVAISAGMVDELGLIKAKIADLTKVEKALVAKAKAAGYGRFEGNLFEMNIFSSDRTNVDWKAIAERVGYSPQLLAAHTSVTESVTLKVTARSGLAEAA